MDIDMHYYGTYALARAAGLGPDIAQRIAVAAEFVDDSTDTQVLINAQGARFRGEATAHHPADFAPNNDPDDQLQVWLPFHFLPGASGTTQSQKLVCVKNSVIAQEMVKHHLESSDSAFGVEMVGITAHVYADTFAHYGFSGVSSRLNRVAFGSIDLKNGDPIAGFVDRFFGKFGVQGGLLRNFRDAVAAAAGTIAEDTTGALGHGSVATFPDQPYLEWSYEYELPALQTGAQKVERQNANDYMEAAQALHRMFADFYAMQPKVRDPGGPMDFQDFAPTVREIVTLGANRDGRIAAWMKALEDGKMTKGRPDKNLTMYDHQPWRNQTNQLMALDDPQDASSLAAYKFHQAAALHRYYVLRQLLPQHGIYVI